MQRKTQIIAVSTVAGLVALALAKAVSTQRSAGEAAGEPAGEPSTPPPRPTPARKPAAQTATQTAAQTAARKETRTATPSAAPSAARAATAPTAPASTQGLESAPQHRGWPMLLAFGAGLGLTLLWFMLPGSAAPRRARAWRWLKRLPGRAQDGFWAFVRHEDPLPELDDAEEQRRWMPDRLLRDQIRQALGGLLPHPRNVQIRVRRGFVRLGGKIPADLKAELLKVVQDVPGVMELEDRLEPV